MPSWRPYSGILIEAKMAKIYFRNKNWNITYYSSGKRIRKRIGKDRRQAEIYLKEIEYRLSVNDLGAIRRIPLAAFKSEFLEYVKARRAAQTHSNYSIAIGHFLEFLRAEYPSACLQDVTLSMADKFISSRRQCLSYIHKDKPVAASTVNTELKAIKRFFNRGVEVGYLKASPARTAKFLTMSARAPRFFSEDELRLIFSSRGNDENKQIYLTLFWTGLRVGELVNLEWDDIDFKSSRLRIRVKDFWKPKGNRERCVPLHPSLQGLLLNKKRLSRWVFSDSKGEKIKIHSLQTSFRRLLKKLGIVNASIHTWRHSFASYFIMKTGNIRALQVLLGHGSIRTTEIYSHLSDQHLQDLVGQLQCPNLGTNLGTALILLGHGIVQVVDKEGMGDTGFEPVTSTV